MPASPTDPAISAERKALIERLLAEGWTPPRVRGGRGAVVHEAARQLAMDSGTLESWLSTQARRMDRGQVHFCPDWSLYQPPSAAAAIQADASWLSDGRYLQYATPRQAEMARAMIEHGNVPDAAVALGISETSLYHGLDRLRSEAARRECEIPSRTPAPDEYPERLRRYQQPRPQFFLRAAPEPEPIAPAGEARRVLVIPDRHNDPRYPHRLACTTWIARFGSEHRIPDVVCLGDAGTFDSVSRHAKDDTIKGRYKPKIADDLDNHLQSLQAFERGRDKDWKPRKKKARGNHEERLWAYEDANPAAQGTHTLAYEQHLLQFGWRERPYGEIFYIGGVGFTHAPLNGLGRPMGGVTLGNRAGALLTQSLVHGHTHQRGHYSAKKLGSTESVSILQCGCALPWNEIEEYTQTAPTGWWWGVVVLTIQDGVITDDNWVSMITLRNRYSDDGGDAKTA